MISLSTEEETKSVCVVRLSTNYWGDKRGLYIKKSINILKRRCVGYNIIQEDCSHMGFDEVASKVVNLNEVQDGIYEVITCNESRDWETNNIEDYDYKLVPVKGEN